MDDYREAMYNVAIVTAAAIAVLCVLWFLYDVVSNSNQAGTDPSNPMPVSQEYKTIYVELKGGQTIRCLTSNSSIATEQVLTCDWSHR